MEKQDTIQKYFHIYCYWNEVNRKIAATNLWRNGVVIFKSSYCIKHFDSLKKEFSINTATQNNQFVLPFIFNNIIDKTRAIICFENYMKGILILKGYLTHNISINHKILRSEQVDRPIKVSELPTDEFFDFSLIKPNDEKDIRRTTINFSWMLKPNYQEIIGLPTEIIEIVKKINNDRNQLHFLSMLEFTISPEEINNLDKIIIYVNEEIDPKIHSLDLQLIDMKLKNKANSR